MNVKYPQGKIKQSIYTQLSNINNQNSNRNKQSLWRPRCWREGVAPDLSKQHQIYRAGSEMAYRNI